MRISLSILMVAEPDRSQANTLFPPFVQNQIPLLHSISVKSWLYSFVVAVLVAPMACGSSQARDRNHTTAVTMLDP